MADEKNPTLSVCVGNYGYYNEGELHDKWVDLPVKDDAELKRFLADNGLYDRRHEEVYISDYDGYPFDLSHGNVFCELTSLSELNLLAKMMEAYPLDCERIENALSCGCDAPDTLQGLMNWVLQADDFLYFEYEFSGIEHFRGASPETLMGYTIAEQSGITRVLEDHNIESFFDYEDYGRYLANDAYLGGEGYVDACLDFPDQGYYSTAELYEEIEAAWNGLEAHRAKQDAERAAPVTPALDEATACGKAASTALGRQGQGAKDGIEHAGRSSQLL